MSIAASSEERNRCRIPAGSGLGESICPAPEMKNTQNSEFKQSTIFAVVFFNQIVTESTMSASEVKGQTFHSNT